MGKYGRPIDDANLSGRERAQKALDEMGSIKEQAMRWVKYQKELSGNGVSTLCMIYNATGNDVNLVGRHDWAGLGFHGGFKHNPVDHYPKVIANGEIGVFLHVHEESKPTGSIGAVVYRGVNGTGDKYCDFMLAWYNSWNNTFNRAAYSEVREMDHYKDDGVWV
ncbi:hypothetical protein FEM48_Zijuj05G0185600 [Ziziphus jujuba var. spinosa]|uniref:23 kDa jasmonate-induced protein-like n=1 Tax=Ziziphus jujuba var. spinosa TaxID=714518 RepID=A0A978VGG4_ZIZJJ|nr:hypothetical protein FEM48_Zijuj05G0185600 [Ziziphus jujuba var. spinosa]